MARDFRKRRRCETSGKLRFATERQACSYAKQISMPWMYAYRCPCCRCWHLSRPPERKAPAVTVSLAVRVKFSRAGDSRPSLSQNSLN